MSTTSRRGARRAWLGVPLAAAMAVTLLPVTGAPAAAHPGIPSPVFDPDAVSWASIRDASSAGFQDRLDTYRRQGFLPVDIDIEVDGRQYRAGAVFQRNLDNRDWTVIRDLTSAEFGEEWRRQVDRRMRLVDQESYLLDGVRRYAAVFVANTEGYGWASKRNMTTAQAHDFYLDQRATRMPVDVDSYGTPDAPRFALAWVDNAEKLDWRLHRQLTSAEFSEKFAAYQGKFRVLAFDSMQTAQGQRYSAIWVENRDGRGWAERRDLTAQNFANWWHRYSDEGYRLVGFDRYQTVNGPRYTGIWRQNSDRPNWSLKNEVNQRVLQELTATDVPGISVAVTQGNQLRYLRGFGHADVNDNEWMDGTFVGPFNSVSKAVAGALTMDVAESSGGAFTLGQNTRDQVPQLPNHHTHEIGELTSLRGCVGHYGEIPAGTFDNPPYPTAEAAVNEFAGEPLACTPGTQWKYSTHSYSVLGWALEEYLGEPIGEIVEEWVTQKYGLASLRPIDLGNTGVRRMTLYSTSNTELTAGDSSYKVLGGGLEGSVRDMARFGQKLVTGQILGAAAMDDMLTPPDGLSSYAHGWWTGTENGHEVAAKDGNWPGSRTYLRVYPEDDVVVAVMSNRDGGGHSPIQLGRDIGAMILAELDA
ncbi:serine hydrolase [Amycolatopsis aidingensis]|uniref:serine hydrolase n=1 Tax=Amycolatopsis aidingensis TaxID=2842453 RepID=UPI001C0A9FAB|nr:serine hydrolase [Amycolatopsis aidingensis]